MLDPRHGSSCHPAHRAVPLLLTEALKNLPTDERPRVWLEEVTDIPETLRRSARAELALGGLFVWPGNRAPVVWYDATQTLPNGRMAYSYAAATRRVHASQDRDAYAPREPPSRKRMRVPFVNLTDIDPREDLCTKLALERPTFDIPGNMERALKP
jgi:hypothetical protein